jgi:hypothetical protein
VKLCRGCGSDYERWHADYCPADGWGAGFHEDVSKLGLWVFRVRWYFRHNFLARIK